MEDKNHIVTKTLDELRQRQKTIQIQIEEDEKQKEKPILNVTAILSLNLTKKLDELIKMAKNVSSSLSSLAHKETLKRNSQDELRKKNKWIDLCKLLEFERSLLEELPKIIESIPLPPSPQQMLSSSQSVANSTSSSIKTNMITTTTTSSSSSLSSNDIITTSNSTDSVIAITNNTNTVSNLQETSPLLTMNSVPQIENLNFIRDSLLVLMLTMLPPLRTQNFDLVVLCITAPAQSPSQLQQSDGDNEFLSLPNEEDYKKNAIIFVKRHSTTTTTTTTTTTCSYQSESMVVDVYLQYTTYKTAG
jgi:hypothetical protein